MHTKAANSATKRARGPPSPPSCSANVVCMNTAWWMCGCSDRTVRDTANHCLLRRTWMYGLMYINSALCAQVVLAVHNSCPGQRSSKLATLNTMVSVAWPQHLCS